MPNLVPRTLPSLSPTHGSTAYDAQLRGGLGHELTVLVSTQFSAAVVDAARRGALAEDTLVSIRGGDSELVCGQNLSVG